MTINSIITYLKKFGLSQLQGQEILEYGRIINLEKGQYFSKNGEICHKIGIVIEGILYGHFIDKDGEKKTTHLFFSPHNYLVADYKSYTKNSVSKVTIEAIENTKLLVFERDIINQLYKKYPELIQLQREIIERMYLQSLQLIKFFQTRSAMEKIKLIQNSVPELLAKVPYSHLASYIGIHRNTFRTALQKL